MTDAPSLRPPKRATVLNALGALLLLAVVLPFAVFAAPQAIGADGSYVVVSSSMSPTIDAGDAVVVRDVPASAIKERNVITYKQEPASDVEDTPLVTHRVIDASRTEDGRVFTTKGDANEESDGSPVPAAAVVGAVWFHIPYIGYVITFASTEYGFFALVGVPIGLIILNELWEMVSAYRAGNTESNESRAG